MPWSPLLTTRSLTSTKRINCSLTSALEFLHDPKAIIDLNPLVIGREPHPNDPNLYTIKDRMKVLGRYVEFDYTAKFTFREDGCETEVRAPGGTTLKSRWTASEVEGGVEVREEVTATTYFFLMPMTISGLKAPHDVLRERLAAKLEGRSVDQAGTTITNKSEAGDHSGFLSLKFMFCISALALVFSVVLRFGSPMSIPMLLLLLFLAACISVYLSARKSRDPYGTFHVSLNRPLEEPRSIPNTEWLNMGYWKDTDEFPKACEALALKLIKAARCQQGGHVLDVGHGSGDSLLLHLRHPSVPRPSCLTGITSLRAHYLRSCERVRQTQKEITDIDHAPEVHLFAGDAVYHPSDDPHHPLSPTSPTKPYTTILALDCAYHFNNRHRFLQQSFHHLASGGRIALADICFASTGTTIAKFVRYLIGDLGVVPKENVITVQQYYRQMVDLGYVEIEVEDISKDVFPSFTRFLSSRGVVWGVFARVIGLLQIGGARFVIITGKKP
ncbi:unnamed protein product [Somion occarium]|uniref:DUF7053 domain-containing protein n=1 Tax=Somion occarium TaxID=3059160 RepID=A0ABP1CJV3_9APHY